MSSSSGEVSDTSESLSSEEIDYVRAIFLQMLHHPANLKFGNTTLVSIDMFDDFAEFCRRYEAI
jgi:hypothetical protein